MTLKLTYLQNHIADSNQILHKDKDHQLYLLWVVQNRRKTNPRWRKTAAILEIWKSPFLRNCLSYRNEIWQDDADASKPPQRCKIWTFQIQNGGRPLLTFLHDAWELEKFKTAKWPSRSFKGIGSCTPDAILAFDPSGHYCSVSVMRKVM